LNWCFDLLCAVCHVTRAACGIPCTAAQRTETFWQLTAFLTVPIAFRAKVVGLKTWALLSRQSGLRPSFEPASLSPDYLQFQAVFAVETFKFQSLSEQRLLA